MDILEGLNKPQQEAVTAIDGRINVVAGAGSGKTKTLAHRYAYLVEEVGINPANILCLTFTNKAAQEMKSRIAKMVHTGNYNDFVSTIHGFCVKLLRREIHRIGYPKTFTILDDEDMKVLAKEVMEETGETRTEVTVKQFLSEIGLQKATFPYIEAYLLPESMLQEDYSKIENKSSAFYLFLMKQQKAFGIDFHDIINMALYLLENFDDVREYWQNQFDYVIVDETQDCNKKDWALLEILTDTKDNLFVVGDPDQAIYEWRGAAPSLFVNFKCDQEIILDENYRSNQNILNVANSVIENNVNRIKKDLYTRHKETSTVFHFHEKSQEEEVIRVTKEIQKLHKSGTPYSDIAILFRSTYLSRPFEQQMMKEKIQYVIYGGIRFFERKEIKDALSYLRLICSEDDLSFKRILNVPSRKLGDVFMKKISTIAEKEGTTLYRTLANHIGDKEFSKQTAVSFVSTIEEAKQMMNSSLISELLSHILKTSGYENMLRVDEDTDRLENLSELLTSILDYERINAENEITLSSYLQDIALYTNMDYKDSVDGAVKLMTIHQSKGLEFPYVFVVGLSEGIMPNHRAIRERKESALEEERRLMYVAITRAEKALYLTESEGFNFATRSDKYPSRFLTEIKRDFFVTEGAISDDIWQGTRDLVSQLEDELTPKQEREFEDNSIVYNKVFGKGTVISYNEEQDSYQVKFDKGIRNIVSSKLYKPSDDVATQNINPKKQHFSYNNVNLQKLIPGVTIEHQRYGVGKIIKTVGGDENTIITIDFKEGEKMILAKYAKIKIIE